MGKRLIVDYSINKLLGQVGAATAGGKNNNPSVTTSSRQKGISTVTGKKTKHQIAKEKQEAAKKALEEQIAQLEAELKAKDELLKKKKEEEKKAKRMTTKDLMLDKIKNQAQFGGSLDDFKVMLKNLLE
jgi:flagellar motor protein MotB